MNKFKNPDVVLIGNPVNIDRPIQDMQIALASLGWIDRVFGRAWLAVKSSKGIFSEKKLYYPHVWQGLGDDGRAKDLLEVLPNDNIKSQVFFRVNDPISLVEFVRDGDSIMEASVDIIFWFNLRAIDATIDYPFVELLKGQALSVLSDMTFSPDSTLTINAIHEQPLNVFRGYNIQDLKDEELVYPWGGFRFECSVQYREDCPQTAYDLSTLYPGYVMQNGGFFLRT
jgi:hypothetical protein